jgi:SEC-C motif-containing protein
MSKKIGRNDPCWCGSGLKYKKCHWNRVREKPVQEYEIRNELRKLFNQKYCLHPDASPHTCGRRIVKAHTIQRKGGLNRIAGNGHVYTFLLGPTHAKGRDTVALPELIGINEASTFMGFCNFHDNKTFEPIENDTFESNQHHAFLLAYRAICREVYEIASAPEMVTLFRSLDKGRSASEQKNLQETLDAFKSSFDNDFREIQLYKTAYDRALQRSDFSEVRYYVVRFDCIPDVLCSGAMHPQFEFQGTLLQDLRTYGTLPDHLSFSLITTDTGGAAVFSWLGENRASEKFVKSLASLSNDLLPHTILRFTFEHFENIFVSPDWWEGLAETAKQALLFRQMTITMPQRMTRDSNYLSDDGLRVISWKIVARETNLII